MALTKRCPNCGASNAEQAEWCSLCLERFPQDQGAGRGAGPVPPSPASPSAPDAPAAGAGRGPGIRATSDGIVWDCATCGNANDIDLTICAACGTPFADMIRPKQERPQRDPGTAALLSLLLPGMGHVYMGLWGQGLARATLSLWVLLVTVIGIVSSKVPGALFMTVSFGIASVALWTISAHDAFREASGQPALVLLQGRRFLFVVLGLIGLLFVVMFAGTMAARS